MLTPDKESNITTTDKVNTTDKPVYVIEIGSFKLSGADIGNLSALSLILYLLFNFTLKSILNSKLTLTLAIILGSLVYWFFLSFLQIKSTTKPDNNNNTEN